MHYLFSSRINSGNTERVCPIFGVVGEQPRQSPSERHCIAIFCVSCSFWPPLRGLSRACHTLLLPCLQTVGTREYKKTRFCVGERMQMVSDLSPVVCARGLVGPLVCPRTFGCP